MNHLVFLDARAGELEKILSGVKTILVKEFDPTRAPAQPVNPGDNLYFLRDREDCAVRVKATVVQVMSFTSLCEEDRSHTLKAMQPRLQFTEDQYNFWREKEHVLLIEFTGAVKIEVIYIGPQHVTGQPDWIAFETISQIQA